ncbi:MAG: FAD-dependent oxidoreductase [Planctomycetes bacterium]|nr:FAD-dependent oxidoreductase [Planctomycetota bacterium]
MSEFDYDVVVIGCGTAGSRAARVAGQAGAHVLAVDSAEELGGLCILRGCMPTKTLLETAHRLHEIRDAERFGIQVPAPTLDFAAHMERMRALVKRFQRAKIGGVEAAPHQLRRGAARFVDAHTVEVDGDPVRAKAFVIASGSVVRPLPVPVAAGAPVVDSDAMFELSAAPKTAVVLGAGAVGLEFAQWLARIGAQVTLINRSPILSRVDAELGLELHAALAEEMELCVPATLRSIEVEGGQALVNVVRADGHPATYRADLVLNAVGRVPAYEDLGLQALGAHPELPVSPTQRTSLPHVFVAGDATGRRMILHEANLEGEVAGRNAARVAGVLGGDLESYDAGIPPVDVIFSDPPFANVGCSQQTCEREGTPYRVATKRFPEQGRGIVMGAKHGAIRLLAEPGGGKVLGCQIVGPRADDLIHLPATIMSLGATVRDMHRVPWYHPTLAEAFIEVTRELSS